MAPLAGQASTAACQIPWRSLTTPAGTALGARVPQAGITLAFTSADMRKLSKCWRWKATSPLALQQFLSLISTYKVRVAAQWLPLDTTRFSVRYIKPPKYYFTGANIRYFHMRLQVLTHSSQIDHLHSRNVQLLLQYMSYNSSFYSDSSQECFAKI